MRLCRSRRESARITGETRLGPGWAESGTGLDRQPETLFHSDDINTQFKVRLSSQLFILCSHPLPFSTPQSRPPSPSPTWPSQLPLL